MFFLNKTYKRRVLKELKKNNLKPIFKLLKKLGYHREVWLDEAHAFLLTNETLISYGIDLDPYKNTIIRLESIFNHYS